MHVFLNIVIFATAISLVSFAGYLISKFAPNEMLALTVTLIMFCPFVGLARLAEQHISWLWPASGIAVGVAVAITWNISRDWNANRNKRERIYSPYIY